MPVHTPRLEARHYLVTGGSRGIGRASVIEAARRGARVSLLAREASAVAEVEADCRAEGLDVRGHCADVTDESAIRRVVSAAESDYGPVDVLVNNAAVSATQGPVGATSVSTWWSEMSINVLGVFTCASAVLPTMTARGSGRIINLVSGTAGRASPYNTAYACSKAAVVRLTDSLAEEVRANGVMVFALRPGNIATRMIADFASSAAARRWLPDEVEKLDPQPPDIAVRAILWLAEGHGDALSGRWVDAGDDLERLVRRVDEIQTLDLYTLRRQRLA